MTRWLPKSLVFVFAALAYLTGQYFLGLWLEGWAPNLCLYKESVDGAYCNWPYFSILGLPLVAAGKVFAIIGIILLFANESGWSAWLKTSAIFVPVAVLGIIFFPVLSPFMFIAPSTPDYEGAVWLFGIIYILITLGIVVRHRHKRE